MALTKRFNTGRSVFSFLSLLIFVAGIAASFLFMSCTNSFTNDGSPVADSDKNAIKSITIKGEICITGAVPELFSEELQSQGSDRAALPSYSASEVEYFAFAESNGKTVEASFGTGTSATTFSLILSPGQNWTITCGIKKAGAENAAENYLLWTNSEPFDPEDLTTDETLKFFPVPDTSTGAGQLDLTMTIDSTIKSVVLNCVSSNKSDWPASSDLVTVSDTTATIKALSGSTVESIKSGLYEVMIAFYGDENVLLYATVQNITIGNNLTTSAWVSSGGESPIDSSGVFNVTTTKIQSFASTHYFVAASALGTEAAGFAAPADTNSGSHKSPFATLGRALSQIANSGISTNDYTIYISGEQKVADTATAGFEISGLDDKMNSLTLTGLSGNESDILNGNAKGCTLKITSTKNITVRNLTIKNGSAVNGGGIGKFGSGQLSVENCIVTGNTASEAGGGFCSFEFAGDCTIKNCSFTSNTAGTNGGGVYSRAKTLISNTKITGNTAAASGGGCYFRDKDMTISGTQTLISQNHATSSHGGGICGAAGSTLLFSDGTISENTAQLFGGGIYSVVPVTMTSGTITGNKSLDETTSFESGGGGVCVKNNTFTMSGGTISGNVSGYYGGGIFIPTSDSTVILSGTAVVGDITKNTPAESDEDKHSNSAVKGGGIFNYEGKLYIGYKDETSPDSSFSGGVGFNYVTVHGGGIYSIGSTTAEVYINKAKIFANTAGTYGGGIDIYNGKFEISNSQIKNNKSENGGGLGLGRTDGNPTCSIQNTIIQNNKANSNGGAIYLYGGNTTLIDVEITNNQAVTNAGGIFFNAAGTKVLSLGKAGAESTITVKNNTEGSASPYTTSNIYLNTTDLIKIDGALSSESEIGITRAGLLSTTPFTNGFKTKNPEITPAQVFSSDNSDYEVTAIMLTGEARLSTAFSVGPALKWYYSVGDTSIELSEEEIVRVGLPVRHNKTLGTSFALNKTSSGPFYDEETDDVEICTGEIHIGTLDGTQVSPVLGTSTYTIAPTAISDDTNMYLKLTIGTVYLDPVNGNDANGGWNKDIPVQTVAQAKSILKGNTKTNPAIKVMNTISDASEITALNNLTIGEGGAVSDYNGAIVKRQASFVSSEMLNISSNITLQNVTLDGGAVWTSSSSDIEVNPDLLTARANATSNSGVKEGKYLISVNGSPTLNYVTIQNCDNSTNGANGNGAAMYIASGTVTLNNCAIKDCSSVGGAVYATINGILNATDTHFSYNLSKGTGASYGNGGAVVLYGATTMGAKATFNNCSFRYNAALRNGGAINAGNKTTVTFENMGSAVIEHNSAAGNGNFMWSAASNLKLLGDFAFGTSPDQVDFYINNISYDLNIQLGAGFGSTGTSGQALLYLSKSFEDSVGKVILAPVSGDSTVNIATAKTKFMLAGTDADCYEITDEGKISPVSSGGSFYTAMDYVFTLTADKTQVTRGEDSVITITPTVKRKEANGNQTSLYFNPSDSKLYEDSAFTVAAGGNKLVSWSASLMCGQNVEVDNLSAATNANQFTIPGLTWEDDYTLNVTLTYMGVVHDANFAVECVAHAFNSTPYTPSGSNYVLFGDWPQSAVASGVTVNEGVSVEIGALTYYLGSDKAWYAKYDDAYFKVEPVKWKILTTDASGKKLLFADKALFGMPYVQISSYLNDQFINTVFSAAMQNTIDTTEYGKIFLLSRDEVSKSEYGFAADTANDDARVKYPTEYASKTGVHTDNKGCWWIFRSEGTQTWMPYCNGQGYAKGDTKNWENNQCGTVPAMWVVGY